MDSINIVSAFQDRWKPAVRVFKDRTDAGIQLGNKLIQQYGDSLFNSVVLGCARGGLVVAEQVARMLGATLDVIVCRKISHPDNKELGVGAIGEDGEAFFIPAIINRCKLDIASRKMKNLRLKELKELNRRKLFYRGGKERPTLKNRTVVIVDDGMASGATVEAALRTVRKDKPKRIIIAQPISSPRSVQEFIVRTDLNPCDICIDFYATPAPGQFWDIDDSFCDFSEVSHLRVCEILWVNNPMYLKQ